MAEKTIKEKTIIIIGTGSSGGWCDFNYRDGVPIPNSEIYGVNGAYTIPKVMPEKHRDKFWMSKLFMTDTLFSYEQGSLNFHIGDMNEFAEKYNCEIYTLNEIKLGKHALKAKKYPYKAILDYFGTDYFTDTVTYMIAFTLYKHSFLAINENGAIRPELKFPLTLRLFGIDMSTTREYQQSKGGVEFWLGIARGMGCSIENSKGSAILSNPHTVPYGFWHKLKYTKKKYDPLGLMKGKEMTQEEADKIAEKMKEEEDAQRDRSTDTEGDEDNQPGVVIHSGGGREPI